MPAEIYIGVMTSQNNNSAKLLCLYEFIDDTE